MAEIDISLKGTNVASAIVPFTTEDTYPTHKAKYGQGGYRTVDNITERDEIPSERLEEGMLVYVINDNDNIHTYQYIKDKTTKKLSWQRASFSAQGIPVYDQKTLDDLGKDAADNYIFIPSESELEGGVPANQTEIVTHGGSYLNILFSAIRQLQVEVAKMRNAFRYGLNSYTGTQTAMSTQVNDIEDPDEEPLWAIEPDMLSIIAGAEVIIDGTTAPSNLTPGNNITLEETKLIINSTGCTWYDVENIVKNTEDTKLFLYLTFSKGDSTTFELNVKLEDINVEEDPTQQSEGEEGEMPVIDLKTLLNKYGDKITNLTKYNILIVVSRQHTELGGSNYVWVSIGSPEDGKVAGYYNFNNKSLYDSKINLNYSKYTFKEIELKSLDLYQLDFYSKYQDFSNEVSESDTTIPEAPSDNDYKYKVAHITIRSIENKETMESIQHQLLENELIFNEEDKTLWIKMKNKGLVSIAGSGGGTGGGGNNDTDNDNMTIQEIIEELKKLGIIYGGEANEDGEYDLNIASISDITFIHQATGNKFKFETDKDGQLRSTKLPEKFLEDRVEDLSKTNYSINESNQIRGFVAKLHCGESGIEATSASDVGLNSDRIKIGSVYMPLNTDTIFGCSHAYIELENTSDKDFPLQGCYLHYLHPNAINIDNSEVEHLALSGTIPAGGTFLIRGKEYSDPMKNLNTFINVDDFDIEWFNDSGELMDLTQIQDKAYAFLLTYGKEDIKQDDIMIFNNTNSDTVDKAPYIYPWYFIDSLILNKHRDVTKKWGLNPVTVGSNTIVKNTFELDPAKQAFQSLNTIDSSRSRLSKVSNDIQLLRLDKESISFKHSDEVYPISKYTPKSSKYKKNVSTDKTQFILDKPNAVTCAFGIDVYKTRCFNWVSAGEFDEFVWIKKKSKIENNGKYIYSDIEGWDKFESYKSSDGNDSIDSETNETPQSSEFPRKRIFNTEITNTIYSRIKNIFPGCGIRYTSHKCIIDLISDEDKNKIDDKIVYTYIVGRADKTGNAPDLNHSSEEQTFTIYPKEYKPRLFLTTDQQGFHWIEYQVWSASAKHLNNEIETIIDSNNRNSENDKIFPILLNTGDMTQNGTRVNEWLDYFNGGKILFNHLEHMAVVGNNDLCGPDPKILGTGNDNGKSNSYFFHVFTCYETFHFKKELGDGETKHILPIVKSKYVPSLYYFDTENYRFLMANSEITFTTCATWYGLNANSENSRVYNIYTGHGVVKNANDSWTEFDDSFTSIYTMMWNILNDAKTKTKETIISCHEMPYTVITTEGLYNTDLTRVQSRSIGLSEDNKRSLVGCHMNQLSTEDNKSMYWFSRLCEYFKVRLVLGGHKHTYAITLPTREYYYYEKIDGIYSKNSIDNGPMEMRETLENDDIKWIINNEHLSKFPILHNYFENTKSPTTDDKFFWPYSTDIRCIKINEDKFKLTEIEYTISSDYSKVICDTRDSLEVSIDNNNFTIDDVTYTILNKYLKCSSNSINFPIINNSFTIGNISYIIEGEKIKSNGIDITTISENKFSLLGLDLEIIEEKAITNDNTRFIDNFVTYLMCQATGYKQTSNKELPTNYQSFSKLIPKSQITISNGKVTKSEADNQQKYPMYVVVDLNSEGNDKWAVYLSRICNILKNYKFTQEVYSELPMVNQYATIVNKAIYLTYTFTDIGGNKVYSIDEDDFNYSILNTVDYKTKYCFWINFNDGSIIDISSKLSSGSLVNDKGNFIVSTDNIYKIGDTYVGCLEITNDESTTTTIKFGMIEDNKILKGL